MKIEYLQRILIDKLDELKCIYSSDFITEMKNDILNEEDIEKLKELDGFATDGIYLQYFKDNIQRKISPLSLSIFELKNYIKDGEGVGDLGDYENNFHKSGDSVNEVSDSLLGEGEPNEPEEYENNRDSIDIELEDDEDDGIDLEDDGIDLDIGSDYWDDFNYSEEGDTSEEDEPSIEDLVEYSLDDEEETEEEPEEELNEEDLVEYDLDDEDDSDEDESDEDSGDLVEYDLGDDEDDSEDEDNDSDDSGDDSVDYNLDDEDNEDLVEYDLDSDDEDLDEEDLDDDDYEDSVDYSLDDEDDSENDGLGFEMDSYLDSLLGNNSDTDKNSSDDSDTSNNSAKSNSNSSASQNTLAKPANNTKEKVFNNDFSNNAWDILNGAVDGISKIIRKF